MNVCILILALTAAPQADLERLFREAAAAGAPYTVGIKVEREPEPEPEKPEPPPLPFLFPGEDGGVFAQRPTDAWCTGTLLEAEGTVITTYFNVSGKVKSITVRLPDGRTVEGKILGYDAMFDLAAIAITAADLPVALAPPDVSPQVGDFVLALGRDPDGEALTANPGIISAPSRLAGRVLQIDARLNYGNVGGPLVDAQGRLIAVTCKVDTKYAGERGQNSGVGFAVRIDRIRQILPNLKEGKNVAESGRPYIGIEADITSPVEGVKISRVVPNGAAALAGIVEGDIIVGYDGRVIRYFEELREAILRHAPGDRVTVIVLRGEERKEFECQLGWLPE